MNMRDYPIFHLHVDTYQSHSRVFIKDVASDQPDWETCELKCHYL